MFFRITAQAEMKSLLKTLSLIVLVLPMLARDVRSQTEADAMQQGIMAFRAESFEEAARYFERASEADPGNAEAYFLLARIYFETPLKDDGKAGKMLDKALQLEPENVQYQVARLEHLRAESSNFFSEKIRENKRESLAKHILELDSTNSFAHEELGILAIRDFWRYRNSVALPYLGFEPTDYNWGSPLPAESSSELPSDNNPVRETRLDNPAPPVNFDPNLVNMDDRFDLETMESQGVIVQDLTKRADRAYDRAVGHLELSLATDPRRRSVYENLLRVYALRDEPERSLELLGRMYEYFQDDAFLWSNLGYAQFRSGNVDEAAVSFERALEKMTPEERSAFESLEYILPEDEQPLYRESPEAYSARFWTSKDPRYLTTANERKLEHYSRIVYADLLYDAPDLHARGWETDRGRILIRYGVPRTDVTWMASGSTNQRSTYASSQLGTVDITDFSSDPLTDVNRFNIWEYGDFRFVFEDPLNNGRFRLYSPSASDIASTNVSVGWINDYEIRAEATFRKVPDRYDFKPPGRKVDIPFLTSAFAGSEGATDLYVHFGIPITGSEYGREQIELVARTGVFLVNDRRDIVAEQRKTVYGLRTEQILEFEESNVWINTEQLEAPAGAHELSVEFETVSGGTVAVQRRAVDIPRFESELALSDVMLAYRIEEAENGKPLTGADVIRNGLSIMPAPWSVFGHTQPIYLYFEVYNLRLSSDRTSDFEVEARLKPRETSKGVGKFFKNLFGGGEKGVSVRLPVAGSTSDDHQYLILDVGNQEPGLYTLEVSVRDQLAGKTVDSKKDLLLE